MFALISTYNVENRSLTFSGFGYNYANLHITAQ